MPLHHMLLRLLQSDPAPAASRWLAEMLPRAANGSRSDLLAAYTGAARALGTKPLTSLPAAAENSAIAQQHLEHWSAEDAGRLLCLLERAGQVDAATFADDAAACYEQGDAREQASWLRGLALLPGPERFLPHAVDACRTNILTVFKAITCDNPYPAEHFPELHFNQMVLKALFNGVALERIVGLAVRANPTLARMANDYADERRAAGRSVPSDLALATVAATPQRTKA